MLSFLGKRFTPDSVQDKSLSLPYLSESPEEEALAGLSFRYPMRRYQQEILALTEIKMQRGERELHIVAPPGAGKTIIGLQLISTLKQPSLVVCPTTTIQMQWGQKLDLFLPEDADNKLLGELIGTHEDKPLKPITLLTYQVLSTPGREIEYLQSLARQAWVEELVKSMALSQGEAELRILELLQNNKKAHDKEISRHIGRLRRRLTEVLDLNAVLHPNALELIQALRRQRFKTVIFDECHHLTDYWAAIMAQIIKRLDNPLVIGLTGTPPEGKSASQEVRYLSLVGEIDYQVPTPALVKEAGLAPFQDLVLFTEPTREEETFLEEQHDEFHQLLEELTEEEPYPLRQWIAQRIKQAQEEGWTNFFNKRQELAAAIGRFIFRYHLDVPTELDLSEVLRQQPVFEDWIRLIEDFALNHLKISASAADHKLYDRIKRASGKLGYGLTEKGMRKQQSPVDRVLAFSKSKARAVASILETEYRSLDDRLRSVVVTDFERMSATAAKSTNGVLSEESGGAIAVLREFLKAPVSQYINPCLVTGSLLLVDNRIQEQFHQAMARLAKENGHGFEISVRPIANEEFSEIFSSSSEWESRNYVALATALLELGITKCLIGTRGIFGEGWDCQSLNTLIDLTTTTTPMSVKQLRGRSLRINTKDPLGARKVANNWDVVCIAPQLEKGLNDYQRFVRKHQGYFGISDDGHIESGVGHVHPAFSELTAAEVFMSYDDFNNEMQLRALARDQIYDLWKVGQPYHNKTLGCIEISRMRKMALTPPNIRFDLSYREHAKLLRNNLAGVWFEYGGLGLGLSGLLWLLVAYVSLPSSVLVLTCLPFITLIAAGRQKYIKLREKLKKEICRPNTQESSLQDMGIALLRSLQKVKVLPGHINKEQVCVTIRSDGSFRVFLDETETQFAQLFTKCFKEMMEPIGKQPYLIPKYEFSFPLPRKSSEPLSDTAGEAMSPLVMASSGSLAVTNRDNQAPETLESPYSEERFFKAYLKGRAEPHIGSYHVVPQLLARSEKGRNAFQEAWNKYVSPGFIVATETRPEVLSRYFGLGPSLAQRLLWE